MIALRAAWRYRFFIFSAIASEFRGKYARSRLGMLWGVLQPLAQSLILAFVLADALGARLPGVESKAGYAVYLLSGMIAWNFFSDVLNRSISIFIEYGNYLKKVAFPRICLPFIVLGATMINSLLLSIACWIVMAIMGWSISIHWIGLIPVMILLMFLAFGIGITLGVLNVFSRDVAQITAVTLQIFFWLTPIAYATATLPVDRRWLIEANPLTSLIEAFQQVAVWHRWPNYNDSRFLIVAIIAMVFCGIGIKLFSAASHEMVDAL